MVAIADESLAASSVFAFEWRGVRWCRRWRFSADVGGVGAMTLGGDTIGAELLLPVLITIAMKTGTIVPVVR